MKLLVNMSYEALRIGIIVGELAFCALRENAYITPGMVSSADQADQNGRLQLIL